MTDRWREFVTKLESSDPDRVNDVIDDVEEMDVEDRIELCDVCFDELVERYAASDDGYVRQSFVRVADRLTPGIATVFVIDDDRSTDADAGDVRDQTDALCGFLLEAITDDDGRVRQPAGRGLKDVFRTYDSLGDEETIDALARELEQMAAASSGTRQKHLLEAKADAEFILQSDLGRLVEGFRKEFGDLRQPEE